MKSRNTIYSSRLAALLSISLLLSACASSQPAAIVVDPVAEPEPPAINVEMIRALTQMNDLKEELKLMRNSVEEMQFQQENAARRQQDLYQDIDRRLLAMERNEEQRVAAIQQQPPLTPSEEVLAEGQTGFVLQGSNTDTRSVPAIGGNTDSNQATTGNQVPKVDTVTVSSATLANRSVQTTQPTAGSSSVSLTEQDAYDNAFEMLKQSRYQDALDQFQSLVNTWPKSQLADDAMYWMSEANYVNREFEAALNGFRSLVQNYPDSSRLPEAMLKVGYIQYDIGAYDQAAETFQNILARFPGHQVTVPAETRLRRIQQTIQ